MTQMPETVLDAESARLCTGNSDWTAWGRYIRRAATRATVLALLESARTDAWETPPAKGLPEN